MVGRNDKPRCLCSAAPRQCVFISGNIIVPEFPLPVVGLADLPMFGGVLQPLLESLQLLSPGDVQVKLENVGVMLCEAFFKCVDPVLAAAPNLFRHQIMYTDGGSQRRKRIGK